MASGAKHGEILIANGTLEHVSEIGEDWNGVMTLVIQE
jgi:hypothetical protein